MIISFQQGPNLPYCWVAMSSVEQVWYHVYSNIPCPTDPGLYLVSLRGHSAIMRILSVGHSVVTVNWFFLHSPYRLTYIRELAC